jgi:hypothetical protein
VQQKAHYLVMDLPHSDDGFVAAFPAETTEAFLEDHVRAFAYFGGVPTRIPYDNTKIAAAKILGGKIGNGGRASPSSRVSICSPISSDARPRATIRARWRVSLATHGATSWCRFHTRAVGRS